MPREQFDLGGSEIRVLVDEPVWAPTSVLGNVVTMRHQYEAWETVRDWGYWEQAKRIDGPVDRRLERDYRLVRAAGRWRGEPLRPPGTNRFVPGDVAAMRLAVVNDEIAGRMRQRLDEVEAGRKFGGITQESATALDGIARYWLYEATPYFVGLSTLVGLVDTELPSEDDLADLNLAADVAVFFGGDITVPFELLERDDTLAEVGWRYDQGRLDHSDWVSADDSPASVVAAPTITIQKRQPLQVCGVVLHATPDGGVDDLVMWLTAQPENADRPRSIVYGWLSRSMLRHVAINLAAAVAWGHWSIPDLGGELNDDPDARDFRDTVKRGWFRRREPFGGAVGVRVLDVRRTVRQRSEDQGGSHASPTAHLRRRHWQRYRVGPRDDWHYERRLIDPIVVNAGEHRFDEPLTVYRLPLPPTA